MTSQNRLKKYLLGDFTFKRFLASLLWVYFLFFFVGLWVPDYLIFRPPPPSYTELPDQVFLEALDGERICGLYFKNKKSRFTVLYFHGNAEDLGHMTPLLEDYWHQGFSVFSYDYRGYGLSTGRPKEKKLYEDLDVLYKYLVQEQEVAPKDIIVHGRSVGGGLATEISRRYSFGGLILESPFVSAFRVLTRIKIYPFDCFENLKKIGKVRCPILVIHGLKDGVIASWHGKRIFEAIQGEKYAYWVEGAGHNDLIWKNEEEYWKTILNFSEKIRN